MNFFSGVRSADDFAGNITTVGVLPVGGTVSGTFEENGYADWFAIELVAGRHLEITGPWGVLGIVFYNAADDPLPADFFQLLSADRQTQSGGFTATATGTNCVGAPE